MRARGLWLPPPRQRTRSQHNLQYQRQHKNRKQDRPDLWIERLREIVLPRRADACGRRPGRQAQRAFGEQQSSHHADWSRRPAHESRDADAQSSRATGRAQRTARLRY